MVIDGVVIYKTYHDNNQDYFNCKLNWKAKNSLGKTKLQVSVCSNRIIFAVQ